MSISVPLIKNTDTASADTFNKPLMAIETHLNNMEVKLDTTMDKSSVVAHDVPISEDCFIGSLVYFNEDTGEFSPAIAVLGDASTAINGSYITAKTANVVGMVITKTSSRVANILLSGRLKSSACISNCLEGGSPGSYYLSDSAKGKASMTFGAVVQPVLTYIGGDELILNITHQMPQQYYSPIVRGITTESGLLKTSVDSSGIANISVNDWKDAGSGISPYAISDINGINIKRTPVVTAAFGVGDIDVETNRFGEVYILSDSYRNRLVDASDYNLNGVKRSQDSIYTYLVFPSGRESSMTISSRVNTSKDTPVNIGVWLDVACSSVISDSAIIDVFVLTEREDGYISMPNAGESVLSSSIYIDTPKSNAIKHCVSTDTVDITGPCTLFAKITIDNASVSDISVIRAGFTLSPAISGDHTLGYGGVNDDNSSTVSSGVAHSDIPKDAVITVLQDGTITTASSNVQDRIAYGIALNSCKAGEYCKYTINGVHYTDNTLVIGSAYFVGLLGDMTTQSPIIPSFSQRIGRAVGTNTLIVSIEEAIL